MHLTPAEADAYQAVMDYVDTWYSSDSILARSIYGKRAASCDHGRSGDAAPPCRRAGWQPGRAG